MKTTILAWWERQGLALQSLLTAFLGAGIIALGGFMVNRFCERLLTKAAEKNIADHAGAALIKMLVRYGIIIICFIMILNVFGVNTTSLIAVLGAAGVAVGLALKDTLGNIASGIILLFLRSFKAGDFIEFGSYGGTVKGMSLFTTILETPEGIYVSAPNSAIWGTPLKNYTRNGRRRMDLTIGIAYSDSLDIAFGVLERIIAEEGRFLREPSPPFVYLHALADSSVNLTLRAWANGDVFWEVYRYQTRHIYEEFVKAGLTIPFPQRDIHIIDIPAGAAAAPLAGPRSRP